MADNVIKLEVILTDTGPVFEKGDVVILRSGGTLMTVDQVKRGAHWTVTCAFIMSNGGYQLMEYPEHLLETHVDHIARQVKIHELSTIKKELTS